MIHGRFTYADGAIFEGQWCEAPWSLCFVWRLSTEAVAVNERVTVRGRSSLLS